MLGRYYGMNDPVADKLLNRAKGMPNLEPPEDKSITTLYIGGKESRGGRGGWGGGRRGMGRRGRGEEGDGEEREGRDAKAGSIAASVVN